MSHYLTFVSVVSIAISIIVSRLLTTRIIDALNTRFGREGHFLAGPFGGALLFAVLFIVCWIAVSAVLVIPWLAQQRR